MQWGVSACPIFILRLQGEVSLVGGGSGRQSASRGLREAVSLGGFRKAVSLAGGRVCSGRHLASGRMAATRRIPALEFSSESNSRSWKRTEAKAKEVLVGQMTRLAWCCISGMFA